MTVNEFLSSPFLKLPSERLNEMDFYQFILSQLNQYISSLKEVENFELLGNVNSQNNIEYAYNIALNLQNTIINTIQKYYDGKTYDAYNIFRNGLKDALQKANLGLKTFTGTENLYRIRIHNEISIEPKDIFHIPMNQRELISSQRFSISGYPCLYFSNSTFLCWLEIGQPKLSRCHASRFKPKTTLNFFERIKILDISNKHPTLLKQAASGIKKWDSDLVNYLALWPLIFATSIKVKFKDKDFKPEYIIPQFLMQFTRNEFSGDLKLDGIKYSSTHYDIYSNDFEFYNIAIPIFNSTVEPYCKKYTSEFKFTKPISWNYLSLLNIETVIALIGDFKNRKSDNKNNLVFNLVPNDPQEYKYTKFGIMEQYLDNLELISIDDLGKLR